MLFQLLRLFVCRKSVATIIIFKYCIKFVQLGTVFNLSSGASQSKALISRALYGEYSFYWTQDHWMEFRNTIYDCKDLGAGCRDIYSPEFIEYEVY